MVSDLWHDEGQMASWSADIEYDCIVTNRRRHTSVTLGDHFQQFVETRVENGRYSSASEVIRTALRIMEREERQEEAKMEALRASIEKGIKSGRADYSLGKLNAQLDGERR